MNEHTTLCIASGQAHPNILPLLNETREAHKVLVFVSKDMEARSFHLCSFLERKGFQVETSTIEAYDLPDAKKTISTILDNLSGPVTLNITGGTKLITLGAYEACLGRQNIKLIYVDTKHGILHELLPSQGKEPLPDVLDIDSALAAYAYEIINRETAPRIARPALLAHLIKYAPVQIEAIAQLNFVASESSNSMSCPFSVLPKNQEFQNLLKQFVDSGAVWLDDEQQRICFTSEEDRFFANGGWLEVYVFWAANRLRVENLALDVAANVTVKSLSGVTNELDVVMTAQNILHVIECKTTRYRHDNSNRQGNGSSKGNDIIYKLEALHDIVGGDFAKAMLVSLSTLSSSERKRCREYGIQLVEAGEIRNLPSILKEWIKPHQEALI